MRRRYASIFVFLMIILSVTRTQTDISFGQAGDERALISAASTGYRDIKFPFLENMDNDKYHISRVTEHGTGRHAVDFGTFEYNIPLYAMHEGEVVCLEDNKDSGCWGGSGGSITIDHKDGYCSLYWHLQWGSMVVHVGDYVKQGKFLAISDKTGNADGKHRLVPK